MARTEEERFNRTLDQGLVLAEEAIAKALEEGAQLFPGAWPSSYTTPTASP